MPIRVLTAGREAAVANGRLSPNSVRPLSVKPGRRRNPSNGRHLAIRRRDGVPIQCKPISTGVDPSKQQHLGRVFSRDFAGETRPKFFRFVGTISNSDHERWRAGHFYFSFLSCYLTAFRIVTDTIANQKWKMESSARVEFFPAIINTQAQSRLLPADIVRQAR